MPSEARRAESILPVKGCAKCRLICYWQEEMLLQSTGTPSDSILLTAVDTWSFTRYASVAFMAKVFASVLQRHEGVCAQSRCPTKRQTSAACCLGAHFIWLSSHWLAQGLHSVVLSSFCNVADTPEQSPRSSESSLPALLAATAMTLCYHVVRTWCKYWNIYILLLQHHWYNTHALQRHLSNTTSTSDWTAACDKTLSSRSKQYTSPSEAVTIILRIQLLQIKNQDHAFCQSANQSHHQFSTVWKENKII